MDAEQHGVEPVLPSIREVESVPIATVPETNTVIQRSDHRVLNNANACLSGSRMFLRC